MGMFDEGRWNVPLFGKKTPKGPGVNEKKYVPKTKTPKSDKKGKGK